jgi:hypothetical protein
VLMMIMSRMGVNDRGGGKKRRRFCYVSGEQGPGGGTNRIGREF